MKNKHTCSSNFYKHIWLVWYGFMVFNATFNNTFEFPLYKMQLMNK
jgi:hypothetical protein